MIKKVAVIPNKSKDKELRYTGELMALLADCECEIVRIAEGAELLIVLGGDGSILRSARVAAPLGVPILGVNLGRIGFMAEVEINELHLVEAALKGEFTIEERMMLSADIVRDGQVIHGSLNALNDAVLSNGAVSRMVDIELYCGSNRVAHYRADGLIAATPTGSTAYSMSAGGPVIDPRLDCICVTPVSPHSLRAKPMIFAADSVLEMHGSGHSGGDVYLTVDGNENFRLDEEDMVRITKSKTPVRLVRLKKNGFFNILNDKMSE